MIDHAIPWTRPRFATGERMSMIDITHAVSFDLETTGVDTSTAHIVTASLVYVDDDGVFQDRKILADPGIDIPAGATEVHGITTEYAREHGRPHAEVVREVADFLTETWAKGRAVVIYNATYDLSVIKTHCPDFEITGLVIDPLVLDKSIDKYRKGSRRLQNVSAHYGVVLSNAHDSSADSVAAYQIARAILRIMSESSQMTNITYPDGSSAVMPYHDIAADPRSLYFFQQNNAVTQQYSLGKYFEKKGRPNDVKVGWPFENDGIHDHLLIP